jgi:hypothetical protein
MWSLAGVLALRGAALSWFGRDEEESGEHAPASASSGAVVAQRRESVVAGS